MPRKKKVEEPVEEKLAPAALEPVPVEEEEMVWVETVDEIGRHMIQVPKKNLE